VRRKREGKKKKGCARVSSKKELLLQYLKDQRWRRSPGETGEEEEKERDVLPSMDRLQSSIDGSNKRTMQDSKSSWLKEQKEGVLLYNFPLRRVENHMNKEHKRGKESVIFAPLFAKRKREIGHIGAKIKRGAVKVKKSGSEVEIVREKEKS